MKLKEIYEQTDALAPFSLSGEFCEKYASYDNSGILLDCAGEIDTVLLSLDLSAAAINRAKQIGAQLILTHHPAIFQPLKKLTAESTVTQCATSGISILSAHLNLDCAEEGIDDSLVFALGGTPLKIFQPLSLGGYGRVSKLEKELPLNEFVSKIEEKLHTRRVLSYGERTVKRIASFCGAGMDEESILFAHENGADTFVSSDAKHHLLALILELNMNAVVLTHYAAENFGFFKFYQKIKEKLPSVRVEYFTDERLM